MKNTINRQWTRTIAFIVLVMWMGLSSALAQNAITVKGQVLDAKSKEPLIGVSVLEKGTSNGTITDFDGNYVLNVPQGHILVFSYVGYSTQEIPVIKSSLNVSLKEDTQTLNEVVVVGYGVQKKVLSPVLFHR